MQYWLFKSEPDVYSIDDLANEIDQTTYWDGVRNYQARNFLRDTITTGDKVFFYYSRANPMVIAGTMEVVKAGYPDHTAFDPTNAHYDPKSDPGDPAWYMVDVKLTQVFPKPVSRDEMKHHAELAEMMVLKPGARLSIQPVTRQEWKTVHILAGVKEK